MFRDLDRRLATILRSADVTGRIEGTLEARRGRRLDRHRADLGRLLFVDNRLGLHEDNWCAGCHSPAFGFGESQSIAIGVQNNGLVGGDRRGPRNQRKAPVVINSAFFPKLMLNGRFAANSGYPFDNSRGYTFPQPEGDALKFPPHDPQFPTLLSAQAHIPRRSWSRWQASRGPRAILSSVAPLTCISSTTDWERACRGTRTTRTSRTLIPERRDPSRGPGQTQPN